MRFNNVSFNSNTIRFTDENGVEHEEDFFALLIRWGRQTHHIDFNDEIAKIVLPETEDGEPQRMTFAEAVAHFPKDARKTAVLKVFQHVNLGVYKAVPRMAERCVRIMALKNKIKVAEGLYETTLNCLLNGDPIPAPPKRTRKPRAKKTEEPTPEATPSEEAPSPAEANVA